MNLLKTWINPVQKVFKRRSIEFNLCEGIFLFNDDSISTDNYYYLKKHKFKLVRRDYGDNIRYMLNCEYLDEYNNNEKLQYNFIVIQKPCSKPVQNPLY